MSGTSLNEPAGHVDDAGVRLGMWLFLYTEIMLFGGLFVLYAVYYHGYRSDFIRSGRELDLFIGTLNTAILLASSYTVVASIEALKNESKKRALVFLGATVLLGLFFLFNKYHEWGHKFEHGFYPGSATLMAGPKGQSVFFGLYFTLTGLHAIHVFFGITLLLVCWILAFKNRITGSRLNLLENAGLFWHLIDVIWIFLFPLFYLIL